MRLNHKVLLKKRSVMAKQIKKSEFMNAVKNVLPASIHQDLPNINVPKICDMVGVNYFLYGSVDQKNKESYDLVIVCLPHGF